MCQGSLKKRHIIDSWHGSEYSSGSEFTRIQALAYWEPEEYDGPFSTEPCVTLAYSELGGYLEPCRTSIMENFIQNHV